MTNIKESIASKIKYHFFIYQTQKSVKEELQKSLKLGINNIAGNGVQKN
jgi:hypothetical protein